MKILHIIPSIDPRSGGPAMAVFSFIKATPTFDHIILSTNEGGINARELPENCIIEQFSYWGNHSFKWSPKLLNRIDEYIDNKECQVAHIHAGFSFISMRAAYRCRKNNLPYIYRPLGVFSDYSMSQGRTLLKRLMWPMERKNLISASVVHTTSDSESKQIKEKTGRNEGIAVIPIPVDITGINVAKGGTQKHNSVTLGYISRIHPKKNIEHLFEALKRCSSDNYRLNLAGDGSPEYIDALKHLAEESDINVRWLGFLEDEAKEDFWTEIDWFILPSFHENYGIVVAEALSKGKPVIMSDQVELGDYLSDIDCVFITGTDAPSIRVAIEKALDTDHKAMIQLSDEAHKVARERFSYEAVKPILMNMYQQAVDA